MPISRRALLGGIGSGLALAACARLPQMTLSNDHPHYDYVLTAEPAPIELIPGTRTPAWCFNGGFPAAPIRARQGREISILFRNRLPEPTTIHWHGLRIPIEMDGVPFLSQPPVKPGEDFVYRFTPPDAGTFWYHPHVNSLEQLGRGLVGAIIVDEAEPVGFDQDVPLLLKNWHIQDDGGFAPFTSPRAAFRMGTAGAYESVNGIQNPSYSVPPGALVRLRFLNVDNTVMYKVAIPDHPAWIIAIDGSPVAKPIPLEQHEMGPGMRLDVALVAPAASGKTVSIKNAKGRLLFNLLELKTAGEPITSPRQVAALPANPLPKPDLAQAEVMNFVFEWEGAVTPVGADGKPNHRFWTINRRAWEGMSATNIPQPLATLELGKTYIFRLKNVTPHSHPIHLHGFIWTVLGSNQKTFETFHTDTVLLQKNEQVEVAFVADNPGRWMYHCHVIEHMKTGLMGYITVK
ncbi:multicopper oxidase family protein [Ketobacter sp.]|uniref:multicopper oxidase family protein n=1 Tax=Ketobacter sp. TaxID=2083498 RepID=UPI000F1DA233|nr:multicopper oxidase family protein [Ketobacter sp.]RLT98023.1 MAG: multicopper oxidase family protein [Ketobacter sp.]